MRLRIWVMAIFFGSAAVFLATTSPKGFNGDSPFTGDLLHGHQILETVDSCPNHVDGVVRPQALRQDVPDPGSFP